MQYRPSSANITEMKSVAWGTITCIRSIDVCRKLLSANLSTLCQSSWWKPDSFFFDIPIFVVLQSWLMRRSSLIQTYINILVMVIIATLFQYTDFTHSFRAFLKSTTATSCPFFDDGNYQLCSKYSNSFPDFPISFYNYCYQRYGWW